MICQIKPHGPSLDFQLAPEHSEWLADRCVTLKLCYYNFTPEEASADLQAIFGAIGQVAERDATRKSSHEEQSPPK